MINLLFMQPSEIKIIIFSQQENNLGCRNEYKCVHSAVPLMSNYIYQLATVQC